jgi:Mlc titration factor MtfA (ptsG expression regulator)
MQLVYLPGHTGAVPIQGDTRHSAGGTPGVADALTAVAPADVARLDADERRRWLAHASRLLQRASWEGARGAPVGDPMRHAIAAHAALLTAGFETDSDPFRNVAAIIVHRGTIITRGLRPGPVRGSVTDAPQHLAGQSGANRDPLLLDWRTFHRQRAHPELGENVVFHEFAHKLDQLTGDADGMPPLAGRAARDAWEQTMGTNFRRLRRRGRDPLVRAYGTTNRAEYFAVLSELLFTRPLELRAHLPRVYAQLSSFYGQDPAHRAEHHGKSEKSLDARSLRLSSWTD